MDLTGLSSIADVGGKLIDRLWPDPATRDAAKLELTKMTQTGELALLASNTDLAKAQIDVNKTEAQSNRIFIAGPRSFVLWMCGISFGYCTLIEPIMRFIATVIYHYNGSFPIIDSALTFQLLFGLLGISGLKSWEKAKGLS